MIEQPITIDARVAVLEAQRENHDKKFDEMASKVNEMHEVLLQAKGARWAILGVASIAGFLAGKLSFIIGMFAL